MKATMSSPRRSKLPIARDFAVRPHWEIGEELGIIDFERGVKIAGTRNYVLRGDGAQAAASADYLDARSACQKHGYTEVYPPYLVLTEMLVGTGQLPKFAETQFRDIEGEKWLIPDCRSAGDKSLSR